MTFFGKIFQKFMGSWFGTSQTSTGTATKAGEISLKFPKFKVYFRVGQGFSLDFCTFSAKIDDILMKYTISSEKTAFKAENDNFCVLEQDLLGYKLRKDNKGSEWDSPSFDWKITQNTGSQLVQRRGKV